MCLKILTYTFIIISFLFVTHLITLMAGVTNRMKPMQASNYVSFSAAALLVYVLNAGLIMLIAPEISAKIIMFIFMLSPIIIGKFASYPKLKFFSVLQILCVIMSGVYVLII